MNLGIEGRHAVVCASSRGLGRACAASLAAAGCSLVINGRDEAKLQQAADELRQARRPAVSRLVTVRAPLPQSRRGCPLRRALPRCCLESASRTSNGAPSSSPSQLQDCILERDPSMGAIKKAWGEFVMHRCLGPGPGAEDVFVAHRTQSKSIETRGEDLSTDLL